MKKNFETSKLYYGFPVIILGYKDDNFGYNITTSSSSYTLGDMVVIGLYSPNNATKQIKQHNEFTLHIPQLNIMAEVEQAGFVSHRDKLEMTGFAYHLSEKVDAPILEACHLVFECVVEHVSEFGAYTNIVARIVGRQIDEDLLDDKGNLDHGRLNPLIYLGDGTARAYRQLDETVTPLGQFMKVKKQALRNNKEN
ncbi:flavin reductase family protein [Streptococcus castoreus]|uniref:flavin reductase family protein n=1 Tax=Streptococcus castoreus TaxID=254786 RepID=UPI00040D0C06|nr:flavin reductase family protein [Streptococcus castoreus]